LIGFLGHHGRLKLINHLLHINSILDISRLEFQVEAVTSVESRRASQQIECRAKIGKAMVEDPEFPCFLSGMH
jgi:hypothetical protein